MPARRGRLHMANTTGSLQRYLQTTTLTYLKNNYSHFLLIKSFYLAEQIIKKEKAACQHTAFFSPNHILLIQVDEGSFHSQLSPCLESASLMSLPLQLSSLLLSSYLSALHPFKANLHFSYLHKHFVAIYPQFLLIFVWLLIPNQQLSP